MANNCKIKTRYKSSEAASKASLREDGVIDKYLNILNLSEFRRLNRLWSEDAQQRFGINDRLFLEENNRAYPNRQAFKQIDQSKGIFYQKSESAIPPAPSAKLISTVKNFLHAIGVDVQTLQQISVNGVKQDANAVALVTQKLIQVVQGKESEALPEEAMHFAVAIIKQTNPTLYRQMLGEVNGYKILDQVFALYGDDPQYQTKEGKRDVVKLKEEAMAKVLVQTIIEKSEQSQESLENRGKIVTLWRNILEFFKSLIVRSGFDTAAMDILSGKNVGNTGDIVENQNSGVFFQKSTQAMVWDKLNDISSRITKIEDDPDEKKNGYYINGHKVPRRVTDLVHDWYNRRLGNNDLTKSDHSKAVDDLKAEKGTAGHKALEYAFTRMVDENGYLRQTILDDSDYDQYMASGKIKSPFDMTMYGILKANLHQRLLMFPAGTRFKSEVIVYDAKRGIAGTIDFMAIETNGKTHVLDWKFMNLNTLKYEDVPWYKITAWRNQMEQYKLILQNVYGVDSKDFGQTRMIPILTTYSEGNAKNKILPQLLTIKIGDADVQNIQEDYLLPVGLETEKTGNKKIDVLLEKLNAIYQKISDQKASPEEKRSKAEQLNELFSAIRQLQIKNNLKPLLQQAKLLNKQMRGIIDTYDQVYKGKDSKSFTEDQKNMFIKQIEDAYNEIDAYVTLSADLRSLFTNKTLSAEDIRLKEELKDTSEDARDIQNELEEIYNDFTSDIIALAEDTEHYLDPEKIVKGFSRWFSSTATLQVRSVQVMYKKMNKALGYTAMDSMTENRRLLELKSAYEIWSHQKGLNKKNMFDILKKSGKNELIDQYSPEFYSKLKDKIEEKDVKWIMENVDSVAYANYLNEVLLKEYDFIDNKNRTGTPEEILAMITREKAQAKILYDTSTTASTGWLLYDHIRWFPKESWYSTQWKELIKPENKPAKDFYDYIIERNNVYKDLDYISKRDSRVFLPFIRKGLMEKVVTSGNIRLGEQFFRDISIDEGDVGYGKIDPLTGKPIDMIPKYFTHDTGDEMSIDLFKNMSMYNEAALRYKYISQIEYQIRALHGVETNKKAIATSIFGRTEYDEYGALKLTKDNNQNSKLVEDMMKSLVYGQRYITSETFDQLLGKIGSWGETLNKKLGMQIFPDNISERQISVNKIITQFNNIFQLNTLGLNVLSATSNLFGGTMNSIINSGKYFTKTDFTAAEAMIVIAKFSGTDRKKMLGALEYFLPLTENYSREIAKDLSVNSLTNESFQDGLMYLMRESDRLVQTSNFYAYLKNTIVQNGQVVNVREYLKQQPKYTDMYLLSVTDRKSLEQEFEAEVISLIQTQGVLQLAQMQGNEFVIPGVDRKSQSVMELRRKVQQISKDALGNLSEDDIRMINLNIYGKSFMVFKNWIPRLVDVRMGGLKYNAASDAYEWGRMRTIMRIISEDWLRSLGNLHNSLVANEKGVEFMVKLFEQKREDYKRETGKDLKMTMDEFLDLTRRNIKNQLIDVLFMTSLAILVLGLKAYEPDDKKKGKKVSSEDARVRSRYRFMVRAADKFKSELLYFYDPTSLQGLIGSGGIFPSMGLVENFSKGVKNFFIETWAVGTGDEKLEKDTKVIKYWMKTFPFTNQMVGYLPMFYPELAKDLGVRIQSNYGIR